MDLCLAFLFYGRIDNIIRCFRCLYIRVFGYVGIVMLVNNGVIMVKNVVIMLFFFSLPDMPHAYVPPDTGRLPLSVSFINKGKSISHCSKGLTGLVNAR